jgi:lipopolysaccharide transport protein LptA
MVTDVQRNRQTALAVRGPRSFKLDRTGPDRTGAFKRARRHTRLVRTLRIGLPIVTLLVFASYGLFVGRAYEIGVGDGKLTIGPVSLSSESVTAENPHFEGFNKDGDKFVVKAKSAEHDLRRSGPIGLKLIEGTLFEPHNAVTKLNAPRGSYDTKTEVLELEERIEVKSNTGLSALLTRATVSIKDNRIVSAEPVSVEMPAGVIRGNDLVLLPKARQAVFSNGVVARFKREAPAGKADAATPADGWGTGNAPIDVTAATLAVDDVKRLAVFSGDARAVQGQANLTSSLLEVGYDGQSGVEAAGAAARATGRINRIVARRDVIITQEADRATCDTAEFDPIADTALLTGNVVVAQGANVLKGGRLFLDRKSATSQLTSPADGSGAKGRISARLHPASQNKRVAAPRRSTEPDGAPFLPPNDPNAPIDIEADRLDVDDRAKSAVFRGNVFAQQGDYTMHTAELIAGYTGDSGLAAGLQGQQGSGRQAMQLKTLRARNSVVIATKDGQSGKGDWADFDVKANLVTLVGNVVLTQGGNTVTGPRAVMNLETGEAQIIPDAASATSGTGAAGSAAAGSPASAGGRPSLLIYPNQLKDKEKAKPKGSESEPKRDGKEAGDPPRKSVGGSATRTSGWVTERAPAADGD